MNSDESKSGIFSLIPEGKTNFKVIVGILSKEVVVKLAKLNRVSLLFYKWNGTYLEPK